MDNFSQLLAFSMAAYLQSCQWQEMWEQIRRKWWGIKQLIGGGGGTKCHRIRPKKSLWLKKSALKGFKVPCEVASLPEPWNLKSHFVRWWMNFQATKLPDKFVAMPLASCQTDNLWQGGGRGGVRVGVVECAILRRQILSASTSVYVKQIFSYSANGSETMTTWGQSAQSKDISVCFDADGRLSGVLQSEKRGSL